MENTQFNELLKSPHLLASMPIEDLETIAKNYPWFSLAHSYLAKAYQDNKSHKTSGQIALASTLHSNRTWLYGFLKEPILQKKTPTELVDTLPTEIIPEIILETTPVTLAPSSTSLSELAASMMEEPEVREVKRGEEKVRQEGREDKRGEEEVRDLDFLDKSILATAVSSSIFLEVSGDFAEQDAEQDSAKDLKQDVAQDSSKDVKQDVAQDSSKDASQDDALFTWLRSVSDSEEKKEEGQEKVREVKRGEEEGRKSTESIQPTLNLIEKFIATEPRITPGKVEQYTGVSFAKDSLEENFDWVTETMAKLYAAQGKIDRARKAYKRLIELHPEKKIHFENQLKVLNQRK
jgi:tetratricopeptide (TPR) repeat protein